MINTLSFEYATPLAFEPLAVSSTTAKPVREFSAVFAGASFLGRRRINCKLSAEEVQVL